MEIKRTEKSSLKGDSVGIPFFRKAGAILFALLVWQIAAMEIKQEILLVTPVQVFLRLLTIWQTDGFFPAVFSTALHICAGFLSALILGILLAAAAARFSLVETMLWPWMASIKAVPVASFVVICLIWLSAGRLSVFISFLIVLPVIYQNVLSGLKSVDLKMEEMSMLFRIPYAKKLRYIIFPQIAPFLSAACRTTVGMAWKAGVAAEVIGTPKGSVGGQLYLAKIYLDTDDLLAWTVVIVIVSVLSEKLFLFCMKKLLGEENT